MRSEGLGDKDKFKKFQEKIIQYVMQNLDDTQDISTIPNGINDPWPFMNGKSTKKLTDPGE